MEKRRKKVRHGGKGRKKDIEAKEAERNALVQRRQNGMH